MGAAEEDERRQQVEVEGIKQGSQQERPNRITKAQFLSWKRQKDADTSARKAEAARKRAEDLASGAAQMNGRELFLQEPWVFDNNLY